MVSANKKIERSVLTINFGVRYTWNYFHIQNREKYVMGKCSYNIQ